MYTTGSYLWHDCDFNPKGFYVKYNTIYLKDGA